MAKTEADRLTRGILAKLSEIRLHRKRVRFLTVLAAGSALVTSVVVISALVAGYWPDQPPAALRWILLTLICTIATVAGTFAILEMVRRENAAQTARRIEGNIPALRNDLINSVLLAEDCKHTSRDLVRAALLEAHRHVRSKKLRSSVSLRPLKLAGAALAIVWFLAAGFVFLQPTAMKRGFIAVGKPPAYVPSVNDIRLVSLSPADATILAGQEVTISAVIRNDRAADYHAKVVLGGASEDRDMVSDSPKTTFTCNLGEIAGDIRYSVRIGQSLWPADRPWYKLTVLDRVEVEGIDVLYEYPAYTALPNREAFDSNGDIEAPLGSKAKLVLRLAQPVAGATVELASGKSLSMAGSPDGKRFETQLAIAEDGWYRISLWDREGSEFQELPARDLPQRHTTTFGGVPQNVYRIRATPDMPPTVELVAPGRDVVLRPGDKLKIQVKASDEYGLTSLILEGWQENDKRSVLQKQYAAGSTCELVGNCQFIVPTNMQADERPTIVYHAEAIDNRDLADAGPQEARTGEFRITVIDNRSAAETLDLAEELRRKLARILQTQLGLRVDSEMCRREHANLEVVVTVASRIEKGQRQVRSKLLDLIEDSSFPGVLGWARSIIGELAANEAQQAVDQAAVVAKLISLEQSLPSIGSLAKTQDRIIEAIQALLALIPSASHDRQLDESESATQDPSWSREQLLDLKTGLLEFAEHQTKAIDAVQQLAETAADTFQLDRQELVDEIIGVQDKLENFLSQTIADLSKLPQQDFSCPVILEELISVKSDVTMVADALSKNAVEIATLCGNNAIENAETITTNIEKWLPDIPDRKKWVMEDPSEQISMEQAELPTELEDLVGDLLEEEADLFEEMEDITSKYAMSGDKGIGWDAVDGPISSMNAQGVTGNQLPNASEVAGRSGEGRTGASGGEFVEDKAVGKGGRRTPTRLTGEPFQSGQVNDVSQDAPGGATGGGKVSGAGQQGLEGPVPPELKRQLDRLAGMQADILSRSRRAAFSFRPKDYSNFAFLRAIILMKKVHAGLRSYRYKDVLMDRDHVLSALRDSQAAAAGQATVTSDRYETVPKYIRKYIMDAADGELPAEYRQPLREYYRRLSEQRD